ncbi:hypothetical protein N7461_009608, partial [Penicillium sp. DV-2018c]
DTNLEHVCINKPSQRSPRVALAARMYQLLTKSLTTLSTLPSASEMTVREYLAMRVLRTDAIPIDRFPIEDPIAERLRQMQLGFNELRIYETHVGAREDPSQHEALGAFQLVRDAHLEVLDITPETSHQTAGPVFRPSLALHPAQVNLIRSGPHKWNLGTPKAQERSQYVFHLWPVDGPGRWSSSRRPFDAVSFGNNQLIAYTDGYLVAPHTLEVFAVVEVKTMIRNRTQHPEALWQEAAEMVAWIMSDVNSRQCPLEQ